MLTFRLIACLLLLCCLIPFRYLHAQDSAPDSTVTDTTISDSTNTNSSVTNSTITEAPASRLPANHSPKRALLRALAVPGWGQMYNRQYWKLPFVYAGLGSVTAFSVKATRNHRRYTRAYQYIRWVEELAKDPEETRDHPFPEFEDEYNEVLVEIGCTGTCPGSSNQLKPLRDNFRRNRDLSRFGIGLVYGLSIIDAFVSAHLLDFDVDEDLTVQILPHPSGATALIRFGF